MKLDTTQDFKAFSRHSENIIMTKRNDPVLCREEYKVFKLVGSFTITDFDLVECEDPQLLVENKLNELLAQSK